MRQMTAEYKKIGNSRVLLLLLAALLGFVVFTWYDAIHSSITLQGYLVASGLLLACILGANIAAVAGAMIAGNDIRWNTLQHGCIRCGRKKTLLGKLLLVFSVDLFIPLLVFLFSAGIRLTAGAAKDIFPPQFVLKFLYSFEDLVYWSMLAFTVTLLSRSMLPGILLPAALINFESLSYHYIGMGIGRWLPDYRLKSILSSVFRDLRSGAMIIIPDLGYEYSFGCHVYVLCSVFLFILVSLIFMQKAEVES